MTEEQTLQVPLEDVQDSLSHWLTQVQDHPVVITEQGAAVGVMMSPTTYAHLQRVQAYFEMLRLSQSLADSGITAAELARLTREELEVRE